MNIIEIFTQNANKICESLFAAFIMILMTENHNLMTTWSWRPLYRILHFREF
jgi:hypothetical protein